MLTRPALLMYETKDESLLSRAQFFWRLALHGLLTAGLLAVSLLAGIAGYAYYEHFSVIDGFLNSAMLLGGMGPVNPPVTPGGKIFAGLYALYAGLVFIVSAALILTPVVHRILHKFHWDEKDD